MSFGLAETAKLAVDLSLKGNFSSALAANQKALSGFNAKITDTQGRAYKAGQQIGTGIKTGAVIAAGALGFLVTQVGLGLRSLSQLDDVVTQTNAVLRSTKGAAGENAKAIRDLATKYEDLNATIDDTVIQSGENLLLTFTNIRKNAFEPTLKAALDMNQALGGGEAGLQGTIQRLGKALNDPIKGLTALQRVGVTFTATQKKQIEAAVKAGDTFKAQGIILAELNKRFGGSFLAGGSTTTGKIAKFKDAIDDLQRALATALLPTIGKVADKLSTFLKDPRVVKTISDLGESIAGLFSDKNLADAGNTLGVIFDTAKAAAPVVKDAAVATLGAVKAAVSLFTSLPKEVQQLAVGAFAINKITGGLVTNIAGGLVGSVLKQLVSGVVNVKGAVVNVGGAGGLPGATGGASKLGKIASLASKVFLVGAAVGVFAELKGILDEQTQRNKAQEAGLTGQTNAFVQVAGIDDVKKALAGLEETDRRMSSGLEPEKWAYAFNIDGVRDSVQEQIAILKGQLAKQDDTRSETAAVRRAIENDDSHSEARSAQLAAAASSDAAKVRGKLDALHAEFRKARDLLAHATSPAQIRAAIKAINDAIFKKGTGGSAGAGNVADQLRGLLKNTHDPQLQRELKAELARVLKQQTYRQGVERQIAKANKLISEGPLTRKKLAELHTIQAYLMLPRGRRRRLPPRPRRPSKTRICRLRSRSR
jgi:hypothetical protein